MQTKLLGFFLSLSLLSTAFADSVDVTVNPLAGTYSSPIHVELSVTDPSAKTFYSFKPNGYPQDAFLYTGAILLRKTTPFVFFSVVSPTDESKIKIINYTFQYSDSIGFTQTSIPSDPSGTLKFSLSNTSGDSVNIGYWKVQSEAASFEISEGTMLAGGAKYDVTLAYTGSSSVVLQSPDGEERGIMTVMPPIKEETKPVVASTPPRKESIVPKDPPSSTPIQATAPSDVVATPAATTTSTNNTETPPPTSPNTVVSSSETPVAPVVATPLADTVAPDQKTENIDASLKSSALESGGKVNPMYFVGIIVVLLSIWGVQFFVRRKR